MPDIFPPVKRITAFYSSSFEKSLYPMNLVVRFATRYMRRVVYMPFI